MKTLSEEGIVLKNNTIYHNEPYYIHTKVREAIKRLQARIKVYGREGNKTMDKTAFYWLLKEYFGEELTK